MATITSSRKIRGGKPVFEGTRISPIDIIEFWLSGMSDEEILKEYPTVKEEFLAETRKLVIKALKEYRKEVLRKLGNRNFRKRLLMINRCLEILEEPQKAVDVEEYKACFDLSLEILKKVKYPELLWL